MKLKRLLGGLLTSALALLAHAQTTTTTFNYTGSAQTFTVPAGVSTVNIVAKGASGYTAGSYAGGRGGSASGDLAVTPGETLYIYVGGAGTVAIGNQVVTGGGFNGGGNGMNNGNTSGVVGGGGGASDVRQGGSALTNRILVAAGGGGATRNSAPGGDGGGLIGGNGTGIGGFSGGTGGSQVAGGTAGGALGQGGNAITSYVGWIGGGGGGYYGGGTSTAHMAGGGGSSYVGGVSNGVTTAGVNTGAGVITLTYVVAVPPPIPNNVSLTQVPGIASQLKVLDLSSGQGPAMTTCLLGTIKQVFGADAVYLGQSSNGAARISVGGRIISFYPVDDNLNVGSGVVLRGDNQQVVGTSCGTFNVIPAVANMADLGSALTAMGLSVQVTAQGVFTATVNGNLYVVRPDYFVTQSVATGSPSLQFGSDGLLRFTDSAGNVQILRAAFFDTTLLQSAIGSALGGSLSIQTDGSGLFTLINGSQLTLAPEMILTPASTGLNTADWVSDRAGHYLYRIGVYQQGLTATTR